MKATEIKYRDRVVFVVVKSGEITIHTGHICSQAGRNPNFGNRHMGLSHSDDTDNIQQTVVWSDLAINEHADSADDAHERSFKINDDHLLSLAEAESLRDTPHCIAWFGQLYPSAVAAKISEALRNSTLQMPEHLKREYAMFQ